MSFRCMYVCIFHANFTCFYIIFLFVCFFFSFGCANDWVYSKQIIIISDLFLVSKENQRLLNCIEAKERAFINFLFARNVFFCFENWCIIKCLQYIYIYRWMTIQMSMISGCQKCLCRRENFATNIITVCVLLYYLKTVYEQEESTRIWYIFFWYVISNIEYCL